MMKHKAVSPIVATTLLIVFTIGISSIIIGWISPIASVNIEKSGHADDVRSYCATARADIVSINIDMDNRTTASIQNVGDSAINLTDAYLYNQNYLSCKLLFDDSSLGVGDFAIATNNNCNIISNCSDFLMVDIITNCKNIVIRHTSALTQTVDGGCVL